MRPHLRRPTTLNFRCVTRRLHDVCCSAMSIATQMTAHIREAPVRVSSLIRAASVRTNLLSIFLDISFARVCLSLPLLVHPILVRVLAVLRHCTLIGSVNQSSFQCRDVMIYKSGSHFAENFWTATIIGVIIF